MAGSKLMLLIALDDPSDLNLRAVDEARCSYAEGRPAILTSSLQGKCIAFAQCLRDLWKCTYLPSADWDEVPMTPSDSECSDSSGCFTLIDSSSTSSTHAKRLETIVFAPGPQFLVVVAPPTVVGEVLKLVTANTEARIAMTSIDSSRRTGKLLNSFCSAEDAVNHLIAVPLRQSNHSLYSHLNLDFQSAPQPCAQPEKHWRKPLTISAAMPNPAYPQLQDINTRLSTLLPSSELHLRKPSTNGESELMKVVRSETEAMAQERLRSLECAVDGVAANKAKLRQETEAIGAVLKALSEGLKTTVEKLAEVSTHLEKAVGESESELEKAVSDTENCRQTLDSLLAAHERALSMDLFTVTNISQRPDLMLVASVYRKKDYSIPCFVRVAAEGEVVMMKEVVIDTSRDPIEIGFMDEFIMEDYEVTIVDKTKSRALSNSIHLSLRSFKCGSPTFEDSLLYQSVGNIEEIEHNLRATAGDSGVVAMKSLAVRWSNPQADRVGQFFELCVGSPAEEMEKILTNAGFEFAKSVVV